MENKLEDTIKKQHQEDFIDLDAVCYYSNIPLSELCSSGTLKLKEKDEERIRIFLLVLSLIAQASVIKKLVQKIVKEYETD